MHTRTPLSVDSSHALLREESCICETALASCSADVANLVSRLFAIRVWIYESGHRRGGFPRLRRNARECKTLRRRRVGGKRPMWVAGGAGTNPRSAAAYQKDRKSVSSWVINAGQRLSFTGAPAVHLPITPVPAGSSGGLGCSAALRSGQTTGESPWPSISSPR